MKNLLVLSALLFVSATQAEANLVSSWSAEGNLLDSVGSNHGTAFGTLGYAPGLYGQGFTFSGDDYISVANPAAGGLASVTGFTLFSVVRFDGPSTGSDTAPLVNLRNASNASGFTLERRFGNAGTMTLYVNTTGGGNIFNEVSTSGWAFGQTYTIAASFNAATGAMKMYRNGALLATTNTGTTANMVLAGNESFEIGRNVPGGSQLVGGLDEVRYYNTALTDAEVAAINPVPEPGVLAAVGVGVLALVRRRRLS